MATWPAAIVADLNVRYFGESSRQIGVDETNDFIFGELQNALRQRLFDMLGAVADVMPLTALPPSPLLKPGADLQSYSGIPPSHGLPRADC